VERLDLVKDPPVTMVSLGDTGGCEICSEPIRRHRLASCPLGKLPGPLEDPECHSGTRVDRVRGVEEAGALGRAVLSSL
jgi:hypothetical protein